MDWTGVGALATLGLFLMALVGFFFQRREAKRARTQSSRVAEKSVESFADLTHLKEQLSGLRAALEPAGLSDSVQEGLHDFEERVSQLEDSIWSAMTVALEAGKRPVVNHGMMKIHVPGLVVELVVDAAMLVEALKDGPVELTKLRSTAGGVLTNLERAIQPAEEQGLVRVVRDFGPEAVQLTDKGRLLARILEAEEELHKGT